eukprot:TRINITY_DN678_c0_g2_i1.p1 TRINITY_DN678_c0_g2~~TRINITY_DN678_c0_g2_i1.p1  ORF type:complete len:299 (+),score=30.54 TRINITY_DN678_c0_g2_i1:224-1120(+)
MRIGQTFCTNILSESAETDNLSICGALIMIGEQGSGKTTFCNRLTCAQNIYHTKKTCTTKRYIYNGRDGMQYNLVDTPGTGGGDDSGLYYALTYESVSLIIYCLEYRGRIDIIRNDFLKEYNKISNIMNQVLVVITKFDSLESQLIQQFERDHHIEFATYKSLPKSKLKKAAKKELKRKRKMYIKAAYETVYRTESAKIIQCLSAFGAKHFLIVTKDTPPDALGSIVQSLARRSPPIFISYSDTDAEIYFNVSTTTTSNLARRQNYHQNTQQHLLNRIAAQEKEIQKLQRQVLSLIHI